jgi:hypothetical protein
MTLINFKMDPSYPYGGESAPAHHRCCKWCAVGHLVEAAPPGTQSVVCREAPQAETMHINTSLPCKHCIHR